MDKKTHKILTLKAVQIFFNIYNTYKLINETYQKDWEFKELSKKNKDQICALRQIIMIANFKSYMNPFNTVNEDNWVELRINDSEHIDDDLNIESVITIFQYLKDRYMKNKKFHITINSCLR
jgi:hypothetical protein